MDQLLVGVALWFSGAYGFSLAALSPTGRRWMKWFAGILGIVIALGVLLLITAPPSTYRGQLINTQESTGALMVSASVKVFGVVYCAYGAVGIIQLLIRLVTPAKRPSDAAVVESSEHTLIDAERPS